MHNLAPPEKLLDVFGEHLAEVVKVGVVIQTCVS